MTAVKESVIEIEVSSEQNFNLYFLPIQQRVRGRFDLNRVPEPKAKLLTNDFPEPIVGQRIGFDVSLGTGYILEPLHDPEHAGSKRRIERRGNRLAEPRKETVGAHQATWLFWMRAAVKAGHAVLRKGSFPDDLGGEPQRSFISKSQLSTEDRLVAAIERQNELLATLLKSLTK